MHWANKMVIGLVTIIVPCYNSEKYLDTCFESLLSQDYENVQLIVVNDGSIDNSEKIILRYAEQIKTKGWEFVYKYQNNQGAAAAVNNVLKDVKGEYLMLYDADDIIYANNISCKVAAFIDENDCGAVVSSGYYFYEHTGKKAPFCIDEKYIKEKGWFNALLYEHAYNWAGTYMIKTEVLFNELCGKDIYVSKYGQNLQVLLPVVYRHKVAFIKEPLMEYIVRNNSVSHSQSIDRQLELQKGFYLNRKETIMRMDLEEDDKTKIIDELSAWNSRKCFIFAYSNGLKKEMKKQKDFLKKIGKYTIKDRVRFVVGSNKLLKLIYEFLHNVKNGEKKQ